MKLIKPSKADLAPLLKEATETQSVDTLMNEVGSNVAQILKRNPAHYRVYGPWWWQVKAAIIRSGHSIFEDNDLEQYWLEQTDYDEPVYAWLAAWAYADNQLSYGAQSSNIHIVETDEGAYEYVLIDDELERRVYFV